jgi:glycine dehydrogenase subunit 2
MVAIQKEAESQPDLVKAAPHTMTVRRLDDVRAARQLDLTWKPAA